MFPDFFNTHIKAYQKLITFTFHKVLKTGWCETELGWLLQQIVMYRN